MNYLDCGFIAIEYDKMHLFRIKIDIIATSKKKENVTREYS